MNSLYPFLGRLHPAWVHLPIGILLLLGILECLGALSRTRRFSWLPPLPANLRVVILSFGAAAAVFAVILGRLLAASGDYDPAALAHHRLLGYEAAGAAVLALVVARHRRFYGPVFGSSLVLLVLAGHAGGSLSHGRDFVTEKMPVSLARIFGVSRPLANQPKPASFSTARLFPDTVAPILAERCAGCHGAQKQNGGLRLDSWDALVRGGKHGPVLGRSGGAPSLLLTRIDLPAEEKGHMPPSGKPQPTDEEMSILEWWASSGAAPDTAVASLDLPPLVDEALRTRYGVAARPATPDRAATLAAVAAISARTGILVRALSPDAPWLDVSAESLGKAFGDSELSALAPIADAIVSLDLGGTAVSNAGLGTVGRMHNLERLRLDLTHIGDPGLEALRGLRKLDYLNLRGTAVSDAGLRSLRGLPRLRALYVWQTAVTPAAVRALGEELVDRRKIARWSAERDSLARLMQSERFVGDSGDSLRAAPTEPSPSKNSPK